MMRATLPKTRTPTAFRFAAPAPKSPLSAGERDLNFRLLFSKIYSKVVASESLARNLNVLHGGCAQRVIPALDTLQIRPRMVQ